jgi:antitoxin (DNA-binding transcriptional repressor) of toxin-antitoxin stability system
MNQRSWTHSNLGKVLWRGREEEKLSFCSEHRDPSPKASFFSRTRSYGGGFVTASVCTVCIATGRYPKFTSAIAKSHSRVSKGETIRITRRGIPIAKLVPADAGEQEDPGQLVREIRELRDTINLGKITIRELIDEGRQLKWVALRFAAARP